MENVRDADYLVLAETDPASRRWIRNELPPGRVDLIALPSLWKIIGNPEHPLHLTILEKWIPLLHAKHGFPSIVLVGHTCRQQRSELRFIKTIVAALWPDLNPQNHYVNNDVSPSGELTINCSNCGVWDGSEDQLPGANQGHLMAKPGGGPALVLDAPKANWSPFFGQVRKLGPKRTHLIGHRGCAAMEPHNPTAHSSGERGFHQETLSQLPRLMKKHGGCPKTKLYYYEDGKLVHVTASLVT